MRGDLWGNWGIDPRYYEECVAARERDESYGGLRRRLVRVEQRLAALEKGDLKARPGQPFATGLAVRGEPLAAIAKPGLRRDSFKSRAKSLHVSP